MGARRTAEQKRSKKKISQKRVQQTGQMALLKLCGTIDYDELYDYKSERKRGASHSS